MSWFEELESDIKKTWDVGEVFTLQDIYELEEDYKRQHPGNSHVRATMRDFLQELRDAGVIEFRGERGDPESGTYRRLS